MKLPAASALGPLLQFTGLLVLTQRIQVAGEVVGRGQSVGVVLAERVTARLVGALEQSAGRSGLTPGVQIGRGTVKQPRDLQRAGVCGVGGIGDSQDVGQQPPPDWPISQVVPGISPRRSGAVVRPPTVHP